MEAALFNFTSFVLFLSFIFLIQKQWKKNNTKSGGKPLPGPPKLPIIGNMHQLSSKSQPLHRIIRELAGKHGADGLLRLQIGELSMVFVSSAEMAKEFLRTHDLAFATRPESQASKIIFYNGTDVAFCPYGDYWRQMRRICVTELLSARMVRSISSLRNDEIRSLLSDFRSSSGQPINLSERIYLFTSNVICRSAFGKVFKEKEEFLELIKEASEWLGRFDFADVFPSWKLLSVLFGCKNSMMKNHRRIDKIIENFIKEHRKTLESEKNQENRELLGDDCLLDVLIRQMDSDTLSIPITDDNIKAIILDMFSAGSETSTSTSVWAISEMMKNPRVFEKAQKEVREAFKGKGKEMFEEGDLDQLPYLKSVVKETLRFHPPVPMLVPRECMKETVIGGYTIPVKTKVMVNAWAIGRDPQYWKDPESFMPERFDDNTVDFMGNNFEFLPFGAGRRICPGLGFGHANVVLPLAHVLYYFDWKLPHGITLDSFDMTEKPAISVGRKQELILIPYPHVA